MSQQLCQLACHTSAGHLPAGHKCSPHESPDCYVQVRAISVGIKTETAKVKLNAHIYYIAVGCSFWNTLVIFLMHIIWGLIDKLL